LPWLAGIVQRAEVLIHRFLPASQGPAAAPAAVAVHEPTFDRNIAGTVAVTRGDDQYPDWNAKRTPTRLSMVDYWERQAFEYPERATCALRLAVAPASATFIERVFSQARAALPFKMGASDPETISKRFFLRLNSDTDLEFIRQHPEVRPASTLVGDM
jgi:hypothetical protein